MKDKTDNLKKYFQKIFKAVSIKSNQTDYQAPFISQSPKLPKK